MSGAPISSRFESLGLDDPEQSCIICGNSFDVSPRTDEDVFPKWLQDVAGIGHRHLTLPDGRLTTYSQLLVPLCSRCNNETLSQLENSVAKAFTSGEAAVRSLDPRVLYVWMAKIYALNQVHSISQPGHSFDIDASALLTTNAALLNVAMRRLNQLRDPITGSSVPGSMLALAVDESVTDQAGLFDWWDYPAYGVAQVRIGTTVLYACLEDGGLVEAALDGANLYRNTFSTPMDLASYLDFSAAFFAYGTYVHRPRYFFIGETGLLSAGSPLLKAVERGEWHERHNLHRERWLEARGL